jgi:hypothetical protein
VRRSTAPSALGRTVMPLYLAEGCDRVTVRK